MQKAKNANSPDALLFKTPMETFRKEFTAAGKALGVENLHPYQLRHGGASEDMSSKLQDHPQVKARGRWKTDQSVRRYAKIGRIQQLLNKLTEPNLQYCLWSEKNLEKVMRGWTTPRSI